MKNIILAGLMTLVLAIIDKYFPMGVQGLEFYILYFVLLQWLNQKES